MTTTAADTAVDLKAFAAEIRRRAAAQFTSRQHLRLLNTPLTLERARLWAIQLQFWINNRRDCWAHVQALAPFDVKGMIWDHEKDELRGNTERGVEDHVNLKIREGQVLGLKPEDFANATMLEGTRTCLYAWLHLTSTSHWLKGVSACAALEITNSSEWVDGGGLGYRLGKKHERELGIPYDKQINVKEHAEVDVDHAHMLLVIAKRHANTPQLLDLMLEGLSESWQLDLVWQAQIAEMMEALPAK
jgi:pyrroloquinoline quinone (PQQ) biosynthesis protein C